MWYTHTRPSGWLPGAPDFGGNYSGNHLSALPLSNIGAFDTIAHAGTALSVSWASVAVDRYRQLLFE